MAHATTPSASLDIGKDSLDLALTGQPASWRFANTPDGHAALITHLAEHAVRRIGLEASGGYERAVCAVLHRAGFDLVLFQPRQVRAYATDRLRRAKTDRLDAHLIAACTAAHEGPVRTPPDPRLAALAEPLRLLQQIELDLARLKTRRAASRDAAIQARLAEEIARLRVWRAQAFTELLARLRAEPDLAARLELVLSIPGLGARTAVTLLVSLPELGRLSRAQAASLAGLAPFDHSSGKHQGARRIAGGRAGVRTALYAAALPAAWRWNPALVACARKLLIYANTVLARGTPWRHTPEPEAAA
ncbi:IS110 family transposase [Methylobacterium nodulans]|uniref:Transposase IS116/IS110/IS902 family protein n=1 Tax=Methylobacterium nodulans (strain LMG 21967 / CNCM I-2342 / ORS 2060) TaxID=460265 RepID=B8IGK0_METNO|nr:IS110 family transposase [Methylobacterium nodulans]ACL55900.1 transposase IS116/IS110/IS902 family protein [Methylobacterium nodulans ORS 2060]